MRGVVAALGAVLVAMALASLAPAEAKETEEFNIGPWKGFSYTSDNTGQFTDCTVWAFNRNNVQLGVSVDKEWHLELWLNSKAWNLPANQSYPVSYWIDRNRQYNGRAETSGDKYVVISAENDQDVFNELQNGSQVIFRAQNDDYSFDLSQSRAALSRLLSCVDQYTKQASTNPFGSGGGSNDQQGGGAENNQQQGGGSGAANDQSGSAKMKELTQTADDVLQFLVDVTGAKPSMIGISTKTTNAGYPYYSFSTPIGQGQFWQEYPSDGTIRGRVARYLSGYKEECKGEFDQSIQDMVEGNKGMLSSGSASCSSSPYQNNDAEVVSYVLMSSNNVVSVYVSYTGGNAAKAKTDNLGKLIARREAAEIK
jgi:hypothetical protein